MIAGRQLTKRERRIAVCTAAIVCAGLLYVYVIEPTAQEWSVLRAEAARLTAEQMELTVLLGNRESIEAQYEEVKSAVTEGATEEALQVSLLSEVEDLARRSGLAVGSIKPMSRTQEGPFDRLHLQLTALCAHHQFVHFLQALQSRERLLHCETISLTVGRGRPPVNVTFAISKLVRLGGPSL